MNYNSVFLFTFVSNIRFLQRKDIEVSYPRLADLPIKETACRLCDNRMNLQTLRLMKTNIYYRLGIIAMIAMCIMTIYEIVDYAISMEILDDPEIYGDNRLLYYPISVLTIASIAGLVLYIRKKVLGWKP